MNFKYKYLKYKKKYITLKKYIGGMYPVFKPTVEMKNLDLTQVTLDQRYKDILQIIYQYPSLEKLTDVSIYHNLEKIGNDKSLSPEEKTFYYIRAIISRIRHSVDKHGGYIDKGHMKAIKYLIDEIQRLWPKKIEWDELLFSFLKKDSTKKGEQEANFSYENEVEKLKNRLKKVKDTQKKRKEREKMQQRLSRQKVEEEDRKKSAKKKEDEKQSDLHLEKSIEDKKEYINIMIQLNTRNATLFRVYLSNVDFWLENNYVIYRWSIMTPNFNEKIIKILHEYKDEYNDLQLYKNLLVELHPEPEKKLKIIRKKKEFDINDFITTVPEILEHNTIDLRQLQNSPGKIITSNEKGEFYIEVVLDAALPLDVIPTTGPLGYILYYFLGIWLRNENDVFPDATHIPTIYNSDAEYKNLNQIPIIKIEQIYSNPDQRKFRQKNQLPDNTHINYLINQSKYRINEINEEIINLEVQLENLINKEYKEYKPLVNEYYSYNNKFINSYFGKIISFLEKKKGSIYNKEKEIENKDDIITDELIKYSNILFETINKLIDKVSMKINEILVKLEQNDIKQKEFEELKQIYKKYYFLNYL